MEACFAYVHFDAGPNSLRLRRPAIVAAYLLLGIAFLVPGCIALDPPDAVDSPDIPTFVARVTGQAPLFDRISEEGDSSDPNVCRASFTTGPTLVPHSVPNASETEFNTWKNSLPTWDLEGGLRQSFDEALNQQLALIDMDTTSDNIGRALEEMKGEIEDNCDPCTVDIEVSESTPWYRIFPTVYARHHNSITLHRPQTTHLPATTTTQFADPYCLAELSYRGAKSFCAMRQAAFEARSAKRPLGPHEGFPIFPAPFDIWTLAKYEPSLRFGIPRKHVTASSEAFAIPLIIGGYLDPITGPVIPGFGELTHPLIWITGDARVMAGTDDFTPLRLPQLPRETSTFQDIAHFDAIVGLQTTGTLRVVAPLFTIAEIIKVEFDGTYTVNVGQPTSHSLSNGGVVYQDPQNPDVVQLPDSNSWPQERGSKIDGNGSWNQLLATDSPIALVFPDVDVPASNQYVAVRDGIPANDDSAGNLWPIDMYHPAINTRYLNDDDRALTVEDSATLDATLVGKVGADVSFLEIEVRAESGLRGTTGQRILFREHLSSVAQRATDFAEGDLNIAQTNVVLGAGRVLNFALDPLDVIITFKIDLLFGSISIVEEIFSWGETEPWSILDDRRADNIALGEEWRLRVGEFSKYGDISASGFNQKPSTYSHLPGPLEQFSAFVEPVNECLSDDELPPPPTPPEAAPSYTPPPDIPLCAIGVGYFSYDGLEVIQERAPLPPNICLGDNPEIYAENFPCDGAPNCVERRNSVRDAVSYLCGGVSRVQIWDERNVISRVMLDGPSDLKDVVSLMEQGGNAFTNSAVEIDALRFLENWIDIKACRPDGTILEDPQRFVTWRD